MIDYGKASACPGINQPLYATEKHPVDDGGPAFPWGEHGAVLGGMTLRDYFAAKALAAMIGQPGKDPENCGKNGVPRLAQFAYEYADAMIEARAA